MQATDFFPFVPILPKQITWGFRIVNTFFLTFWEVDLGWLKLGANLA